MELKVGDKVKVIAENPAHGWGLVGPRSIGTLKEIKNGEVCIDFPRQKNWHGKLEEIALATEDDFLFGDKLAQILEAHKRWLNDKEGGERADLTRANLTRADLTRANLTRADLTGANLTRANLTDANLTRADLTDANLTRANLTDAKELLNPIDYIKNNFETTAEGIIAYKTFGCHYNPSANWIISPGSVIMEETNYTRTSSCACGINVATLDWVKKNNSRRDIWKCLIRWEWLPGVVVPYGADGKIRAARVQLIEIVPR